MSKSPTRCRSGLGGRSDGDEVGEVVVEGAGEKRLGLRRVVVEEAGLEVVWMRVWKNLVWWVECW
jgi:hypothetical protein